MTRFASLSHRASREGAIWHAPIARERSSTTEWRANFSGLNDPGLSLLKFSFINLADGAPPAPGQIILARTWIVISFVNKGTLLKDLFYSSPL